MTESLPTEVRFDNNDVAKANQYESLKDGWYKGVVVKATNATSQEKKYLMTKLTFRVLDENDSPARAPSITHTIFPPFTNTTAEGAVPPGTWAVQGCQKYLAAIDPSRFGYAQKMGNGYFAPDGTELTKETGKAFKEKVTNAVFTELQNRWASPDMYKDEVLFFEVAADTKNPEFKRVKRVAKELPEGETQITSDFTAEDVSDNVPY